MKNKEISLKFSAVALAVLLTGCGGGGSDGYYNTDPKPGAGDAEQPVIELEEELVEEQPVIEISSAESTLNPNGGDFEVTVRLTDNNGGGVSEKEVTLFLDQAARNNGLTNTEMALKTTDINGYATYTLSLKKPVSSTVINDLVTNGVNISAIYTTADKNQLIHSINLKLTNNNIEEALPQYNLRLNSNKKIANVKGDNVLIEAQVINLNGAVISGQDVSLKVLDAKNNFVILTNDKITTNNLGIAQFEIAIPSNLTELQRNFLLENHITVEATVTDVNGSVFTQPYLITVSNSEGSQVQPNITFGRTNKLAPIGQLDYQEEMSVRVIDSDGNPIKDTAFTINMQVVKKESGHFALAEEFEAELAADKAQLTTDISAKNTEISGLNSRKASLEYKKLNDAENFTSTEQTELDSLSDRIQNANTELSNLTQKKARLDAYKLPSRVQYSCSAQKDDNAIATKLSGDKLTNIGNNYTATTNVDGEFKFNITYFKSYAGWQVVRFNVKPKDANVSYNMSYDYPLGILKTDFDSEDSEPFDMSPYNQNNLVSPCPTFKPWSHIL
ncbi:hypothetical protein E5093_02485 [Acinetobacter indicus]|uniref:hypothetical protein n=1 Tax=Acinetobacter indicus TaxID=756892 RepID=UPI00159F475A|nr:hypothetical protein [Acinetobacter indicus]QLB58524.1 hypothetical protein E5093_02485 [Acinetobacter indicus]